MKNTAIVLAAGQGKRMNAPVAKQFLELKGKLLLCYALEAFENCELITDIILVTNADAIDFCQKEVVEAAAYQKVRAVVAGGAERYDSVFAGLKEAAGSDYVFIHDGARPFVSQEALRNLYEEVQKSKACVAAMPVKDTIKVADEEGYSVSTPNRSSLWQIQTPQVFSYEDIYAAYQAMYADTTQGVTDDAMVMERYGKHRVKLLPCGYQNIKITTPEDLLIAMAFLQ